MQAKATGRLFRLKAKAAGAESDFALCRQAENPQDFSADPALCFLVYYLLFAEYLRAFFSGGLGFFSRSV